MNISSYIDHTLLRPNILHTDLIRLCNEGLQYGFAGVCIPPPFVREAKRLTAGSKIKTVTVIGFPFGYSAIEAKLSEIVLAIADGAEELDMVINITALKNNDWQYLAREINTIAPFARQHAVTLKIIIETGLLSEEEIIRCCTLYGAAGVDFLKTSTGYAETGATVAAVQLMRAHLPPSVKIKASGGIRTYAFARQLVDAGADRLGCSASVAIAKNSPSA